MRMKKHIFIVMGLITLLSLSTMIYFIVKGTSSSSAKSAVESKLNIKLPLDTEIRLYKYNEKYDNFKAKLLIKGDYILDVKSQLNAFFSKGPKGEVSYMLKAMEWAHINEDNLDEYYHTFVSGKDGDPITRNVWAVITKKNDGDFNLYIEY